MIARSVFLSREANAMIRALTVVAAFIVLAGATLPAFADCAGHSSTVQATTTPQTVVQSGTTPMTPVPPATPKTGG
jgi:hypothetical protein